RIPDGLIIEALAGEGVPRTVGRHADRAEVCAAETREPIEPVAQVLGLRPACRVDAPEGRSAPRTRLEGDLRGAPRTLAPATSGRTGEGSAGLAERDGVPAAARLAALCGLACERVASALREACGDRRPAEPPAALGLSPRGRLGDAQPRHHEKDRAERAH